MAGEHPIRIYRKRKNLTLEAAGRLLGVTGMTVWRWETGRRAPRKRELPKIAKLIGVRPATLLEYELRQGRAA